MSLPLWTCWARQAWKASSSLKHSMKRRILSVTEEVSLDISERQRSTNFYHVRFFSFYLCCYSNKICSPTVTSMCFHCEQKNLFISIWTQNRWVDFFLCFTALLVNDLISFFLFLFTNFCGALTVISKTFKVIFVFSSFEDFFSFSSLQEFCVGFFCFVLF